jgi:hypothetical protein
MSGRTTTLVAGPSDLAVHEIEQAVHALPSSTTSVTVTVVPAAAVVVVVGAAA